MYHSILTSALRTRGGKKNRRTSASEKKKKTQKGQTRGNMTQFTTNNINNRGGKRARPRIQEKNKKGKIVKHTLTCTHTDRKLKKGVLYRKTLNKKGTQGEKKGRVGSGKIL